MAASPAPSLHSQVSLLVGGNLAHVACDAVVNASNHWLTSGKGRFMPTLPLPFPHMVPNAGVNGALHAAAGPCLLEQCLSLGGCDVGQAKMTLGHGLPAHYVLHTVGPEEKDSDRAEKLRYPSTYM